MVLGSSISNLLAELITYPVHILLTYCITIARALADVDWAQIVIPPVSGGVMVGWYILAGFFIVWQYQRLRRVDGNK